MPVNPVPTPISISILTILITITPIILTSRCEQWQIDEHTVLTDTNLGINIFVDAKDRGISKIIRQTGIHNGELIQFMKKFVREGESIVYVGAHVGIQILAIAKHATDIQISNLHIYAFQPNNLNYILLTKSIYLNNLQSVITVHKAAVTNIQGIAEIAIRNMDTSLADIVQGTTTKRKADYKYQVQTVTIDSVLKHHIGGHKFGFVYLSCNGFQIDAILGMRNLVSSNKQVVVLMQWDFAKIGHKDVDGLIQSLNYFKDNAYKLFIINLNMKPASAPTQPSYTEITNFIQITKLKQSLLLFIPVTRVNVLGLL